METTTCDECRNEIPKTGAYGGPPIGSSHVSYIGNNSIKIDGHNPWPMSVDFCSFKCLVTYFQRGTS